MSKDISDLEAKLREAERFLGNPINQGDWEPFASRGWIRWAVSTIRSLVAERASWASDTILRPQAADALRADLYAQAAVTERLHEDLAEAVDKLQTYERAKSAPLGSEALAAEVELLRVQCAGLREENELLQLRLNGLNEEFKIFMPDTRRLDWLETRHIPAVGRAGSAGPWLIGEYAGMGEYVDRATGRTLREAIDAAMEGGDYTDSALPSTTTERRAVTEPEGNASASAAEAEVDAAEVPSGSSTPPDLEAKLREIEERLRRSTPAPWSIAGCDGPRTGVNGPSGFNAEIGPIPGQLEVYGFGDAVLIANAPTDLASLISTIRSLLGANTELGLHADRLRADLAAHQRQVAEGAAVTERLQEELAAAAEKLQTYENAAKEGTRGLSRTIVEKLDLGLDAAREESRWRGERIATLEGELAAAREECERLRGELKATRGTRCPNCQTPAGDQ